MARDSGFERYLNVLGVADARPDLDGLRRIVRAQLIRVPFENVSKLFLARSRGFRGVPDLDLYLDGIENCLLIAVGGEVHVGYSRGRSSQRLAIRLRLISVVPTATPAVIASRQYDSAKFP